MVKNQRRGNTTGRRPLAALGLLALITSAPTVALATADKESAGEDSRVDVYYENATHIRQNVGLSKFRNTIQVEADKKLGKVGPFANLAFHGKLRGTYDGVYRMNDTDYGDQAGGPINLPSDNAAGLNALMTVLGFPAPPATKLPDTAWGASPTGAGVGSFGFNASNPAAARYNPNQGLAILGAGKDGMDGSSPGLVFGVPVRPCDVDSRGCIKDYMDADRAELESPEFNDRWDFIREAYIAGTIPLSNGKDLFIKLGKQQVVWGRTDLFRVLDVINPVDYSRNNIYDELQDIRIPMWILQAEYRMGASETFDDLNLSLVWNFDKFRPNNLGQGGTPNRILDAGNLFRSLKNCWDNGCTVGNFAFNSPAGGVATDFAPGQIGIREAHLPEWSMKNTQLGIKLEGQKSGVGFSVNALTYRSQLPSLRGLVAAGVKTNDPFTNQPTSAPLPLPAASGGDGTTGIYGGQYGTPGLYGNVPAFDIYFPRVNLIGGSMDFQVDSIKSVFRLEAALTSGEEFANTARRELYSKSKVFRYVIGMDRPTFIPFLNETRAFLFSGQIFGQHILDHELYSGPLGPVGMPDWERNNIVTLLIKGWYMNDRVSPQVIFAHDVKAGSTVAAPSVEWLVTDNLKMSIGANVKMGNANHRFDDNSTAIPFAGLAGAAAAIGAPVSPAGVPYTSMGLTGFEPLGRFRAGPIGMARDENEIQFNLRYKF